MVVEVVHHPHLVVVLILLLEKKNEKQIKIDSHKKHSHNSTITYISEASIIHSHQ